MSKSVAALETLEQRLVLSAINLTLQHSALPVEEGQAAHNFGYAISDSGTVTSVTSDVGTVTFHPQWGLWQWNFLTSDGPSQSQEVTITATDDSGTTNAVLFQLDVINVAPTITLLTDDQTVHQGIAFPLGDLSFADEVTEFDPGTNTVFLDPSRALGTPQGGDNSRGVTLGNGGSITLSFTDNALVDQNSVANGADLYLFDLGYDNEEVLLEISTDGSDWTALASPVVIRSGEPKGIDIASIAAPGAAYHFVRITDVFLKGEYDPFYVGPDIDAVGVVGQVPAVAVNAGQTALASGGFGDVGTDTVLITSSMGAVTQTGPNEGDWSWSLATTEADAGTHLVTIYATDADGAVSTVSFELVVSAINLTLQHSSLSVEEGRAAHNFGYAIANSCLVTSITSTVGAVTFHPQWGLWQWDFLTSDGPSESQDVTITATSDTGIIKEVTFHLDVINVAPTITLLTAAQTLHQGIAFPLGDMSFADAVTAFNPGTNTVFLDPSRALGTPQGGDNTRGVTLGNGGSITLRFTDNALVDQNFVANGADLYLFDLGYDNEEVLLEISTDGSAWIALAAPVVIRSCEPKGIDIASIAAPGAKYHFVRITDVLLDGEHDQFYVGPDIDAVGVVGQVPQVTVNGGQTALVTGRFGDVGTDTVRITASMGAVTQTGPGEGDWSWSLPTVASASGTHLVTITATDADGAVSTASFELVCIPTVVNVDINVRPGTDRNRINLNSVSDKGQNQSNNLVPVVIYSVPGFDARSIKLSTVEFAGAHIVRHAYRDVDGDGDRDLIAYFRLSETDLYTRYVDSLRSNSSRSYLREFDVTLSGQTRDGMRFEGHDVVQVFMSGRALRKLLDSL